MARIPDHELERLKREVDLAELVRTNQISKDDALAACVDLEDFNALIA